MSLGRMTVIRCRPIKTLQGKWRRDYLRKLKFQGQAESNRNSIGQVRQKKK